MYIHMYLRNMCIHGANRGKVHIHTHVPPRNIYIHMYPPRNIYIHMYQLTDATALQGYKCIHMFPGRGKRREKPVQKPI
jgi:hypothetical protein